MVITWRNIKKTVANISRTGTYFIDFINDDLTAPAYFIRFLFTFNIALSIMVLLVAMFTKSTLEFAAFPTILLFSTLLRLSLNIASTRIILMDGHTGGGAAGKVVEAFASFLVGETLLLGSSFLLFLL